MIMCFISYHINCGGRWKASRAAGEGQAARLGSGSGHRWPWGARVCILLLGLVSWAVGYWAQCADLLAACSVLRLTDEKNRGIQFLTF
jgi:hypothetical protein